ATHPDKFFLVDRNGCKSTQTPRHPFFNFGRQPEHPHTIIYGRRFLSVSSLFRKAVRKPPRFAGDFFAFGSNE
ncbi:MAG: hypothetical protein J6332_07220, partial [Abditibacteriota bacterium]|nr:hypothetical protein [Abditibacteriota bacterium]